jgi:hypothetical protein
MDNEISERSVSEWLEIAKDTLQDRGLDYGDPRDNLLRIYRIAKLLGIQLRDPSDVALIFIATKLSRQVESPGREDTNLDLIGYAAILGVTRNTDWDDFDTY